MEKSNTVKLNENMNFKDQEIKGKKNLNFSMKDSFYDTKNYFSIEEINKSIFYLIKIIKIKMFPFNIKTILIFKPKFLKN